MENFICSCLFRCLVLSFSLVFCPLLMADEQCARLEENISSQQLQLTKLKHQNDQLNQLLTGQLQDDFDINRAIGFELDQQYVASSTLEKLQFELNALPDEVTTPQRFKHCPKASDWLNKEKQIISYQKVILQGQIRLLQHLLPVRRALARESNRWQRLYNLQKEVKSWAEDYPDNSAAWQLVDDIDQWITNWRDSVHIWLSQIQDMDTTIENESGTWVEAMLIEGPIDAIQWQNPRLTTIPSYHDNMLAWQVELEKAHLSLIRVSQRWYNYKIWQQGWWMFAKALSKPDSFTHQLTAEVLGAPLNFADYSARPFIHAYRHAIKQDKRGELLSNWFLQALALIALMSALLKLATESPRYVAKLQHKVFTWFQHRSTIQFSSSVLWLIKPNAPWLLVLASTQLIAHLIPDSWFILKTISPLGMLYSVFRAVRVIMEWLLSRTYTRSSQFVSNLTAQNQVRDIHKVAWILVLSALSWFLVRGTGGGYLLFLVTIAVVIITWWAMLWLLLRYKEAVAQFLLYCVGRHKNRDKAASEHFRVWFILLWPLLFALGHMEDLVRHLHQKLLVFDTYRMFAIKLLRMRMAAEAKEDDPETDGSDAPDESYSDWMLRNTGKTRLKPEKVDKVIEQIKQWQQEKSSENIQLIIGEQGSGKSTFIEYLKECWTDNPVRILDIPAKTTQPEAVHELIARHFSLAEHNAVADLVKKDSEMEAEVVIVDNAHNLFLSEVGQLGGFRTLNQFLNARLTNIYWIVVMHAPSWYYLSRVYERELNFNNIFVMPRWSPADIRRLVLSRHQGSRRRLKYNEMLLSASAGSESSSVRAADSRVFNILWEQSNGIPMVALHLWIDSARSKDRIVEIGVPQKPSAASLKQLQDDLCFIFAAIITHESLNSEEIRTVTHFPDPIVRHALKQGIKMGLLLRDEQRRYRVHAIWQGTLSSYLASKNMILTG